MELSESLSALSYDNLIGRKLATIPNLNGMTTAVIERRIPWLDLNHDIASNTCLVNNEPYFREYSIPFYEEGETVKVEEIDLGFYDPDLEARYFYRVTYNYYEHQYSSAMPFYQWEYNRAKFRYETLRYKTVSSTYTWSRELLDYQHEDLPTQYINLPGNVIRLNVSMNSGIGVEIQSDSPFSVVDGDRTYSANSTLSIPIVRSRNLTITSIANRQIHQRYESYDLDNGYSSFRYVRLNDGDSTTIVFPTYIRVNVLGGTIASRAYHPQGDIEELETELIHKPGTDLDNRLIPPGISRTNPNFPTVFWNYKAKEPTSISTPISLISLPAEINQIL